MLNPRLTFIDDEIDLIEPLEEYFTRLGYDVRTATSVARFESRRDAYETDLIILDLNLPGENGLDFFHRLRSTHNNIPVIFLTGSSDAIERIVGLESGAADWVSKPVDPQELAARIGSILARRGTMARHMLRLERATVDLHCSRLLVEGKMPEILTASEIALLRVLSSKPNHVFTRTELLDQAPGILWEADERSMNSRVGRLRRKLDTESIETVRGHGYKFVPVR